MLKLQNDQNPEAKVFVNCDCVLVKKQERGKDRKSVKALLKSSILSSLFPPLSPSRRTRLIPCPIELCLS